MRALAVAVVTATLAPARAPAADPPAAVDPAAVDRANLTAPDAAPAAREEAARRLLANGGPAGLAALRDALLPSSPPAVQTAVARSLTETADPDPSLLRPVAQLLGSTRASESGGRVSDAAVAAVAAYAGTPSANDAFDDLRRFADDDRFAPGARGPAVQAMSEFVNKAAAAYLVSVATDPNRPLQARAAAALAQLSGESDRDPSPARWQAWWAPHDKQSEDAWRAYLLAVRMRTAGVNRVDAAQLAEDAVKQFRDEYYRVPAKDKAAVLLAAMGDRSAPLRAVASRLYEEDLARPPAEPVLRRVRDLVADDDPAVRAAAIGALNGIVDQQAGPPLIAQLRRERNPGILKLIIQAVGKLQVLDAADDLIRLLSDPRPDVATAAAHALGEPTTGGMGRQLKAQRPKVAQDAAQALRQEIGKRRQPQGTPPPPSAEDVRAACVEALSALSDGSTFGTLRDLLNLNNEPWDVRVAALDGLGALEDKDADDLVADALRDEDKRVRLAAAKAMRTVGTLKQVEALGASIDPQRERDASVREAAWVALRQLLDEHGSVQLLGSWATRFPNDPERRLAVRQILDRKLTAQTEDAAMNDQEIAQTLVQLHRPADAIGPLQAALDYYQANQPPGVDASESTRLVNLVDQMLDAKLAAGQYQSAVDFAAKQSPSNRGRAGRKLQDAADQLKSQGRPADAAVLIDAALAMQPPLEDRYRDALRDIRDELRAPPGRGH
jgi:HEAT repeat protein